MFLLELAFGGETELLMFSPTDLAPPLRFPLRAVRSGGASAVVAAAGAG